MITILRKELASFFTGYIAYVSAFAFVLICSLFLWFFDNDFNLFNSGNATLSSFFFIAPWAFLLLIPALTMRSFAGEEQSGTLQWLFTQPIKIKSIVLGKYLAVVFVVIFFLIFTLFNVYTIQELKLDTDNLEYGVISSGYLGLFLVGITFASIGVFCSTITSNPVIAYVLSIFICFLLDYGFESLASYNLFGSLDYYVQNIGFKVHYNRFLKGIIDFKSVIYFLLVIMLFIGLSEYNVSKKK